MPSWRDTAHIEHIKPQGDSHYPELRYCYDNMVLSCNGKPFNSVDRGSYPGHQYSSCGEHKGSFYDPDLFINPVDSEDISAMITWGNDAAMESREGRTNRVDYMIGILNINNNYLNNARQKALGSFQKVYTEKPSARESLLDSVRENRTEFCTFLTARMFG